MVTDVDAVLALQGLCDEAASIAQSLATIAAIQARRERIEAPRELQRLEIEAQRAEQYIRDAESDLRLAREGNDTDWIAAKESSVRFRERKAAEAREAVNRFRLIYAAVLTLQDVSRPEVSA